jgi:carboxylesterase type B
MSSLLKTNVGTFRGKHGDGVVQFLGIRYASLEDQLSMPEMVTAYREDVVDATGFGYTFFACFL